MMPVQGVRELHVVRIDVSRKRQWSRLVICFLGLFALLPGPAFAKSPAPDPPHKKAAPKSPAKASAKKVAKPSPPKPAVRGTIAPTGTPILNANDRTVASLAFAAVAAGKYDRARELAIGIKDPLPAKIIDWLWMQRPQNGIPFEQIAAFIERNPDWPGQEGLARRAEEAFDDRLTDAQVLGWFANRKPSTGLGQIRYGETLIRNDRRPEGEQWIRDGWINGNLPQQFESDILARAGGVIRPEDQVARLDRLLWERQTDAARRMLPRVDAGHRALAEARLSLILKVGNVDTILAGVPPALANDGGLAYDRLRWRREKGMDEGVDAILMTAPTELGQAEKWWTERYIRARKAMADGRISDAYALAANHGPLQGRSLADAEFLAGWIALRFLNDPANARLHFQKLQESAKFPVTISRGDYWLGRTAEQTGDAAAAADWYRQAATYPTTFYGQIASAKLNGRAPLQFTDDPAPSADQVAAFDKREMVRAVRMLAEVGADDRVRAFILRMEENAASPEEHAMTAALARVVNRVDFAVASAKRSGQAGIPLVAENYPLVQPLLAELGPERALVLSLARQESEFNAGVVSPVGARGLMQLMPDTARSVAKTTHSVFKIDWLTQDADYNAKLGSFFLNRLIDNWDGNYVLAIASYNAGEARVRKWIRDWGDPRLPDVDVVDWIELIPFSETRNYVQRVVEGLQIYRQRLAKTPVPLSLDDDLRSRRRQTCNGC